MTLFLAVRPEAQEEERESKKKEILTAIQSVKLCTLWICDILSGKALLQPNSQWVPHCLRELYELLEEVLVEEDHAAVGVDGDLELLLLVVVIAVTLGPVHGKRVAWKINANVD